MDNLPVFVGLDYHTSKVQVCVMDDEGTVLINKDRPNDWKSIVGFAERIGAVQRAAIESCSGAADLAEELVQRAGWPVHLAHPGYVSRMKQNPDKSDYTDARMLADLERVGYLPRVWLAPEEIRELRLLARYRQQQINEGRAVKLRIGGILREQRIRSGPAGRWSLGWLKWLRETGELSEQGRWVVEQHLEGLQIIKGKLRKVEERLRECTRDDPLVQQLMEMPGIGEVTAWTIRAEIGRFDRFSSGKQLSRFCGLSPRNASSGTRQADAGLVKAANGQLRAIFIQAAHRLSRHDPRWSALARQMEARGKPGSVIAAAVANRWIRWLYHQMKPMAQAA